MAMLNSRIALRRALLSLETTPRSPGSFFTLHYANRSSSRSVYPRRFNSSISTSTTTPPAVFVARNATCFPFGVISDKPEDALFCNLDFSIQDGDSYAIIGPSASPDKERLVSVIRSYSRNIPTGSISHPILSTLPPIQRADDDATRIPEATDIIKVVGFKTRVSSGGDFENYTARYYHIREEDKLTLRAHLLRSLPFRASPQLVDEGALSLQLESLLDIPLIALSNGQNRRARILQALLSSPSLLVLEEPFTGLDVKSRHLLEKLLEGLHANRSPRILFILRPQDAIPAFVTHLALVGDVEGKVAIGTKESILSSTGGQEFIETERRIQQEREEQRAGAIDAAGEVVVNLKNITVSYSQKDVLSAVDWKIRLNERWVLRGENGSGKSTLLSMVTGDHPLSFTQDVELMGRPRAGQATAILQEDIGHSSPEIYNSFPRKFGKDALTVEDTIATGFDSIFCYRRMTSAQKILLDRLIVEFDHPALTPAFLTRQFASLTTHHQSLVLILRALVKRPKLIILDECWSGLDSTGIAATNLYLNTKLKDQAVIMVSHVEEELPISTHSLTLRNGEVVKMLE